MYQTEIEFSLMEVVVLYFNRNQRSSDPSQALECMNLFLNLDHQIIFQEKKLIIKKDQSHQKFIKNDLEKIIL